MDLRDAILGAAAIFGMYEAYKIGTKMQVRRLRKSASEAREIARSFLQDYPGGQPRFRNRPAYDDLRVPEAIARFTGLEAAAHELSGDEGAASNWWELCANQVSNRTEDESDYSRPFVTCSEMRTKGPMLGINSVLGTRSPWTRVEPLDMVVEGKTYRVNRVHTHRTGTDGFTPVGDPETTFAVLGELLATRNGGLMEDYAVRRLLDSEEQDALVSEIHHNHMSGLERATVVVNPHSEYAVNHLLLPFPATGASSPDVAE